MDLYARLGLSNKATQEDIKKAFRKLAQTYHPDKTGRPDDPVFKEINQAYQVLSDEKKRSLYDEFGEPSMALNFNAAHARANKAAAENLKTDFWPPPTEDFDDLLGSLFKTKGKRRTVGVGVSGFGPSGFGTVNLYESEQTIDFASAIRGCDMRVTSGHLAWNVNVPPGISDGEQVRVQHASGRDGDLLLTIRVSPHQFFRRFGNDLSVDVNVTVGELYHGGQVNVPSPRGGGTLAIQPKTQSGVVVRVTGHGVGKITQSGMRYGDLYVRWIAVIPLDNSEETARAVSELSSKTPGVREGLRF